MIGYILNLLFLNENKSMKIKCLVEVLLSPKMFMCERLIKILNYFDQMQIYINDKSRV